jgi:hypothetical protein
MPHVIRARGGLPVEPRLPCRGQVVRLLPHASSLRGRPSAGRTLPGPHHLLGESEADKQSLVDDENSPFFTAPHFDGHSSVLLRAKGRPAITYAELKEVIQDTRLSRASASRAKGLAPVLRPPEPAEIKPATACAK